MGCTESLPVAESYNVTHNQTDKNFKPLGSHVGGGPSTAGPTRIMSKRSSFHGLEMTSLLNMIMGHLLVMD